MNRASSSLSVSLPGLGDLLDCTRDELECYEIAVANLVCAAGLPGAEALNIGACLAALDQWAKATRRYTQGAWGEYQRNPEHYHRHRGFGCFAAMVTYLRHPRCLGIGYQPSAIGNTIYSDSRDDFLHGLLTRKLGTCTSLPVLFVAIGRRLGYPMHLAVAKGHVLCQWVEDDGTRVNLEGSNAGGGELVPDERYHHWPHPMTKDDLASGRYLRPLTRAEEFALFLETRGHVLTDNGHFDEGREAYRQAHRVSGGWSQLDVHLAWVNIVQRQHLGQRLARSGTASPPLGEFAFPPTVGVLGFNR